MKNGKCYGGRLCRLGFNGALGHGSTGWQPLGIGECAALLLARNETLVILSYWIYSELVVAWTYLRELDALWVHGACCVQSLWARMSLSKVCRVAWQRGPGSGPQWRVWVKDPVARVARIQIVRGLHLHYHVKIVDLKPSSSESERHWKENKVLGIQKWSINHLLVVPLTMSRSDFNNIRKEGQVGIGFKSQVLEIALFGLHP